MKYISTQYTRLHCVSKMCPPFYFLNGVFQKLTNYNDFWNVTSWENFKLTSIDLPTSPVSCSHFSSGNPKSHLSTILFTRTSHIYVISEYKCSAVAEIGDRLATVEMGWKLAGRAPLGAAGPYLTQCRLGRCLPPYQVASWSIQPFGHNRYAPKIGGSAPFWGRLAGFPSNTM